ncbi:MAG: L-threonylcarbamoyladenylate synthase [Nitrospira sp.]|jgi:L-threonylcarbamoyladenylate synthase|nr:MAG: L-threonylcarbamoyladenylate synthase [Nitrospira sp.]
MGGETNHVKGAVLSAADSESIRLAGRIIRTGGLVAFPTETVYGLGCDAMNADAAAKVFEAKQRPQFDPLIVHIADPQQLNVVIETLPVPGQRLMDAFWPGPLTLVLPKQPAIPDLVTAGLSTVAVRMPNHPVAQAFIREAGTPIAAPSANPFGYVSPTTAQHVADGLGSKVDLILDGGPCPVGVESTIVSLAGPLPELLRPGSITIEQLLAVIGSIRRSSVNERSIAPGQLSRHYATRTPLTILASAGARPMPKDDERAGLLIHSQAGDADDRFAAVEVLSPTGDLREAARCLFAALRRLDSAGLDRIYVEPCKEEGLGVAIMDRLRRCAAS